MKIKQITFFKFCELILVFIGCLFLLKCEKKPVLQKSYQSVNEEFWPYFQKFEEEGLVRGFEIDLGTERIKGAFTSINNGYAIGFCSFNENEDRQILIDRRFWERSSVMSKELILFHELGHCFLKRDHKNTVSKSGFCLSIMRSGKDSCVDHYSRKNREEMLDELFLN